MLRHWYPEANPVCLARDGPPTSAASSLLVRSAIAARFTVREMSQSNSPGISYNCFVTKPSFGNCRLASGARRSSGHTAQIKLIRQFGRRIATGIPGIPPPGAKWQTGSICSSRRIRIRGQVRGKKKGFAGALAHRSVELRTERSNSSDYRWPAEQRTPRRHGTVGRMFHVKHRAAIRGANRRARATRPFPKAPQCSATRILRSAPYSRPEIGRPTPPHASALVRSASLRDSQRGT